MHSCQLVETGIGHSWNIQAEIDTFQKNFDHIPCTIIRYQSFYPNFDTEVPIWENLSS